MSKSPSLPNLEYLKYIEPHLATKILEFILKINQDEELKTLYKTLTVKTKNSSERMSSHGRWYFFQNQN